MGAQMEGSKTPLLWHSNAAHSPTGYGQQTALFTPLLNKKYDVGISAFYGLEGNIIKFNDIPTYPGIGVSHGNETIESHAQTHFGDGLRSGLVVTLMDVWILEPGVWRNLNVASWCPVDHEPLPARVLGYFQATGAVPIAMSKFGRQMMQDCGLQPEYVPHAVDCNIYKPMPKKEAREITSIPQSSYAVGMIAANKGNPSRKCFSEAFQAFKAFSDRHPEAILYLHTELTGKFDGVDLPKLMDAVGLDRRKAVFCDQYRAVHYPFAPKTMSAIYNSLDCYLAPSAGEGFGIPAIEAQACGVPVIVSDFSAQPELVGAGWTVSGHRFYTPLEAWQFHPDVEDILDALNRCYALPKAGKEDYARKARAFAEDYHVDRVLEKHMFPALENVEQHFDARKPEVVK